MRVMISKNTADRTMSLKEAVKDRLIPAPGLPQNGMGEIIQAVEEVVNFQSRLVDILVEKDVLDQFDLERLLGDGFEIIKD